MESSEIGLCVTLFSLKNYLPHYYKMLPDCPYLVEVFFLKGINHSTGTQNHENWDKSEFLDLNISEMGFCAPQFSNLFSKIPMLGH